MLLPNTEKNINLMVFFKGSGNLSLGPLEMSLGKPVPTVWFVRPRYYIKAQALVTTVYVYNGCYVYWLPW